MSDETNRPTRTLELNFPATVIMHADAHRLAGLPLDVDLLVEMAHKAVLQLHAHNSGAPLDSVAVSKQYAEGWRLMNGQLRKIRACGCGYAGFRRDENGFCDDCHRIDKWAGSREGGQG